MSRNNNENKLKSLKSGLKSFKINLCGIGRNDCSNYENLSVQEKMIDNEQRNDNLDNCLTPKAKTYSRSRLPVYYKSPNTPTTTIIHATQTRHVNMLRRETRERFQSTKINENSPTISQYPYLCETPELSKRQSNHKATSSIIERILHVKQVCTPEVTQITYKTVERIHLTNTMPSSCNSSDQDSCSSESSPESTTPQVYKPKPTTTFVCITAHKGVFESDLTVKYADRVQIIQDEGDHFIFVRNVCTQECGYVPRMILQTLADFLQALINFQSINLLLEIIIVFLFLCFICIFGIFGIFMIF